METAQLDAADEYLGRRRDTSRHTPAVAVRINRDGISHMDARAKLEGVNRSELVRRMLAFASAHMPEGWRP